MNANINKAVVHCFNNSLCTSATIMSNMPGFEEACSLSVENKFVEHLGMHLVINEGFPLTKRIVNFDKFCTKEGMLCFSRESPTISLNTSEKIALAEEIRAQIHRCRKNGIRISHIDSHHHVHVEWGIASVLIPIAKEEGIPYIRIARNIANSSNILKDVYKMIYNYRLKINNMSGTKYFGSIEEFFSYCDNNNNVDGLFEIMIHPQYIGDIMHLSGISDEKYLIDKIKEYQCNWKLTSFMELISRNAN